MARVRGRFLREAAIGAVLGRIRRLVRLAISGPGGRFGIVLYGVVLALELAGIWVTVRFIAWNAAFYDALEDMDADAALRQVGVFGLLTALGAGRHLAADWLKKMLLLRWRRALTAAALDRWLRDKTFWRLRPGLSPEGIDNPDQRIAEDCRLFVSGFLRESLDLISNIVGLFSYVAILWSLSVFPLDFTAFGLEVTIPHYMVWAAFLYVALSSGLTQRLGRPLKALLFVQQAREADFRYALVRLRDGASEVALAGGETAERRHLDRRFDEVAVNWKRMIGREFILGLFTRPYFQTVMRIPVFLALPAYLAGTVTLGGLMGLASAFTNVTTTLSWFIFSYRDLADLAATSERLDDLFRVIESPAPLPHAPTRLARRISKDGALRLRGVRLATPRGEWLAPAPDVEIPPGARVWVNGPSGVGKSTLLAAIAGVWPWGEGEIEAPRGRIAFLPQTPHRPEAGFAAAACYPEDPASIAPDALAEALTRVGLAPRLWALTPDAENGGEGLSGGERQRLAFARLLVARPDWVVLDEATSALDAGSAAGLLGLLAEALPGIGFIVVAHHRPEALGPLIELRLGEAVEAGEAAACRLSDPPARNLGEKAGAERWS